MTTLSTTDAIRDKALAVDPVKVVLFAVLLPFLLLGWVVRLTGYVLAFAWIAAQTGYRDAGSWLDLREQRRKAG